MAHIRVRVGWALRYFHRHCTEDIFGSLPADTFTGRVVGAVADHTMRRHDVFSLYTLLPERRAAIGGERWDNVERF
jgi:hypothetical protein